MAALARRWYATYNIMSASRTGVHSCRGNGSVRLPSNRILLIEDDPDVGPLLEHVLLSAGYKVHMASTFAEGQSLLQTRAYDLVLTDVMLPDGNGIAIADAAKERGINTLIITGHAFHIDGDRLARHDYMMKPVRPGELVSAIRRQLGTE
jgi:DNA-binding response OmpR family regulator